MTKSTEIPEIINNPFGNMYSTKEVAQLLKISLRSVQRMIKLGEVRAIGKHRNYRIPEAEVKRWLEKELGKDRTAQAGSAEEKDNTET
jgi:excisionase family DNA binding protein